MFLLSLRDADAAANPFDLDTGGKLFRTRGVPSWRVQAHLRTGAKDASRCVVHVVPKVKQPSCRTLPPQSLSQHHLHPSRPQMQASNITKRSLTINLLNTAWSIIVYGKQRSDV